MAKKRKTARKRKQTRRKPAARRKRKRITLPNLAEMSQVQIDAIGVALIALGAFFGFVLYGGWEGGTVGEGLATGLRFILGLTIYVIPALLGASGVALIVRPLVEEPGRPRLGVALILVSLTLACAAGTIGIGPGAASTSELFVPDSFMDRGGVVGASCYWLASTLFSTAGAHILALVGLFGGALLLSGTSVATVFRHAVDLLRRGGLAGRAQLRRIAAVTAGERARARRDARLPPLDFEEPEGEPRVMALGEPAADPYAEPEPDERGDRSFAAEADSLEDELADEREVEAGPDDGTQPATAEMQAITAAELTPMGNKRTEVTESDEIDYKLPKVGTLRRSDRAQVSDTSNQEQVAAHLIETLGHFGVEAEIIGRVIGPRVTRHELRLAPGTKMAKMTQLKDDLAYALASTDIRILAPIPGKQAVGVEVPNKKHRMVYLGDIFKRELGNKVKNSDLGSASPLAVWLGKDIAGNAVWTDLAKMPHVLVAGTTGSGKSGCVNTMLSSILLRSSPNEVRMVLVDPKRVELNHYEDVPHLLTPVVTNARKAANVLNNLIGEMESRYDLMGKARARNIVEMNRMRRAAKEPSLPYILCVIDELADLMMVAPSEVEDAIIRLAQKSRAVGIHLVLATQRPSVDIITGTIKVNIPARIAFAVSSQTDSRVILDGGGAESLLGQGDMLFRPVGSSKLQRIQGAFITEDEIARITESWRVQGEPHYEADLLETPEPSEDESAGEFDPDEDDLLEQAITLVAQTQTASVSMLQRRLRVGYTRAGRLIDMLERRGVISGYEGSKPRQVLISEADVSRVLGEGSAVGDPPAVTASSDE